MVPMLENKKNHLKYVFVFLWEEKGHDPHEILVGRVGYRGITHSNIHVVDFEEDKFKGIFFYEEVLQKLPDDNAKQEMESWKEEMNNITQEHFQKLIPEDQNKLNIKGQ